MMKSKIKNKSMEEISKGYEAFIEGKEINTDSKKLFDKTIKKAATSKPKQRALK